MFIFIFYGRPKFDECAQHVQINEYSAKRVKINLIYIHETGDCVLKLASPSFSTVGENIKNYPNSKVLYMLYLLLLMTLILGNFKERKEKTNVCSQHGH